MRHVPDAKVEVSADGRYMATSHGINMVLAKYGLRVVVTLFETDVGAANHDAIS